MVTLLFSCQSHPEDNLRKKGVQCSRAFAEELKEIRTSEDLKVALPKMRKRFSELAELILEVRNLKEISGNQIPSPEGDALFAELSRLSELPGGRELIELAQREAILRLSSSSRCLEKAS